MYQENELWKEYKREKDLQTKITEEYKLKQAIKETNRREFDEWFTKLITKNGTTEY